MKKETKITTIRQLHEILDTGQIHFKVKLAPGIAFKKEIIKTENGNYLVATFGSARVVTQQQLDTQPDVILNQINKGRLWTA